MKRNTRITRYIIFVLGIILFNASCKKDFLDRDNPGSINADDVWKDETLIRLYVNKLYNDRPGWDYNTYNNISDEARSNYPNNTPNQILVGQWDEVNNPMGIWGTAYASIRKMNDFFAQINSSPLTQENKNELSAEVYFLRAFMYFDLAKRYGGVPIIIKPQDISDDLAVSRATMDETFQFILSDIDKAIADLPATESKAKASIPAALALKGRVLLYWASPLYNPGNDLNRWKLAADASKAVIDLNKYVLYDDLGQLWLNNGNNEAIFQVEYKMPEKQHGWDALVKPLSLANGDAGQCSPLQNLVDAFPMASGKAINETGSGYSDQNPYVNRDKRFYAFIAYNGAKMKGSTSGPPVHEITLEIYKGGRDFDADPATQIYNTITGYYTVKATNPENAIYEPYATSTQPWMELRYAEVLLNYAEAQNEALGTPDQSVYESVNLIRRRAGITTDLIIGSLSKEAMRSLIRNERYVELCFEGKRYWDLRRWKTAVAVLNNKEGNGVTAVKNGNAFVYSYQAVDRQPNVFSDKMYLMPIPRTETTKNPNLKQNPGWQ